MITIGAISPLTKQETNDLVNIKPIKAGSVYYAPYIEDARQMAAFGLLDMTFDSIIKSNIVTFRLNYDSRISQYNEGKYMSVLASQFCIMSVKEKQHIIDLLESVIKEQPNEKLNEVLELIKNEKDNYIGAENELKRNGF